MEKASRLPEVLAVMSKRELQGQDYEKFWVDTTPARGIDVSQNLANYFTSMKETAPQQVLFGGHRGSGKSTELRTLSRRVEQSFVVVFIDVKEHLGLFNVRCVDLLLLIMDQVFRRVTERESDSGAFAPELQINVAQFNDLKEFLKDIIYTESRSRTLSAEVGAGISESIGVMFGKLSGLLKFDSSQKVEIRQKLEPRISDLLKRCNGLFRSIETQLAEFPQRNRLLIIVENLDKLTPGDADELFSRNGSVLAALEAHVVFTIPNALYYGRNAAQILGTFKRDYLLPMIKVKTRAGDPFEPGLAVLRDIVSRRMNLQLIDPDVLQLLIEKSGGVIRDIFSMMTEAVLDAMARGIKTIDHPALMRGLLREKSRYERSIAQTESDDGPTVDEYYNKLWAVRRSRSKKESNDRVLLDLLLSSAVIEYNLERWLDVHPLVADHLDERRIDFSNENPG